MAPAPLPQCVERTGNVVRQPLGEGGSKLSVGDTPTPPSGDWPPPEPPALFILMQHYWGTPLVLPGLLLRNAYLFPQFARVSTRCYNDSSIVVKWSLFATVDGLSSYS